MKNNWSGFRSWVHNIWVQNCDEHSELGEKPYQAQEYFQTYKYWLKREYTHQLKAQKND